MFGLVREKRELLEAIQELKVELESKRKEIHLLEDIKALKEQIEDLKIQKSRLKEEHDKEDRELRHMIGLEKKRQEVETEQAKMGAVLAVKQENLQAEQKRFEEQMDFVKQQFSEQMKRIEGIYSEIIKRLPTITIDRTIQERKR